MRVPLSIAIEIVITNIFPLSNLSDRLDRGDKNDESTDVNASFSCAVWDNSSIHVKNQNNMKVLSIRFPIYRNE